MAELNFLANIRGTEQQAADLIRQANEQARQIQDNARQMAADKILKARSQAASILQDSLNQAKAQSEQIRSEEQAASASQARTQSDVSGHALVKAASAVAERIVSQHAHR